MNSLNFKRLDVVELTTDEITGTQGGSVVALLLGIAIGMLIYEITH